ncbi:hypothetical protein ACMSEF_26140 [Bacteroides thetaiotaomicron]|uniref:hypothetical protein n=1 Tax=Bacteroides thetaiotaomicron TaxID=818 RepID=UPI0039C24FE2
MLLYNVKKEEMRIGKHKGKTMYYASPIAQDKITTKQLEDRIVNANSPEPCRRAVSHHRLGENRT